MVTILVARMATLREGLLFTLKASQRTDERKYPSTPLGAMITRTFTIRYPFTKTTLRTRHHRLEDFGPPLVHLIEAVLRNELGAMVYVDGRRRVLTLRWLLRTQPYG